MDAGMGNGHAEVKEREMKFKAFFQIGPPWPFGLPQEGMVVVPAPGKYESYAAHARMGFKVKHGTLSLFREDSQTIKATFSILGVDFSLTDNFVELTLEASSPEAAFEASRKAMDNFLRNLALKHGHYYYSKISAIESENKEGHTEKQVMAVRYGCYNLQQIACAIEEAGRDSALIDPRLQKALQYFEHALFVSKHLLGQLDPRSNQQSFLISAVFLNFWKAVTCIIGDPSKNKDKYHKRYKAIGISDEQKTICDKLKSLRNDYDVAHYSLRESDLERIKQEFGKAQELAGDIIKHYQKHLRSKQTNSPDQTGIAMSESQKG